MPYLYIYQWFRSEENEEYDNKNEQERTDYDKNFGKDDEDKGYEEKNENTTKNTNKRDQIATNTKEMVMEILTKKKNMKRCTMETTTSI